MTATAERPATHPPTRRAPKRSREQVLLDLISNTDEWYPFYGPTGALLWRVPGSEDGVTYTVSATSCTCPYDAHRRAKDEICKHRLGLRLYIFIGEMYAIKKRRLSEQRA